MTASNGQLPSFKNCPICENLSEGKVKPGILTCDGCKQQFCYPHMGTHRQELSNSLELLVYQRNQLAIINAPDLSSNEKFNLNEQNDRIDKWESETIDVIRTVANQIRENLIETANKHRESIKISYDELTQELNTYREAENYFESDIHLLTEKLNKLALHIDSFQTRFKIEINDNKIDWTKLIQIKDEGEQMKTDNSVINSSSIIVDQPQLPPVLSRIESLFAKCQPNNRLQTRIDGQMCAGDNILLFFRSKKLWMITCEPMMFSQQLIQWEYDSIIDILWSTYLKDFIVLTGKKLIKFSSKQELETPNSGMRTCINAYKHKLFLIRNDPYNNNCIEEYNMADRNWSNPLNYWQPPVSCAKMEKINQISANEQYVALIILWTHDERKGPVEFRKFELRNHSMFLLRNINLEYCCSPLLLLPDQNQWLMGRRDRAGTFVTIDEELKTRKQTNILSLPIDTIQFMMNKNKLDMVVRYYAISQDRTITHTIEFYDY
ncbi:unnamed protein product [Didymodactylos carnosus]|uniref:B box-type domain-containing protein n=1 Tax=Didymodactylos carnosus TaxID=1234261 RepID=A0A814I1M8_9BILA|nr:unnamed protein product [Didymodactylos carnosus]CAF3788520.1 unnamed protein product [Didymodactylos carnosus]